MNNIHVIPLDLDEEKLEGPEWDEEVKRVAKQAALDINALVEKIAKERGHNGSAG